MDVKKYFVSLSEELHALKNRVRMLVPDSAWLADGEWKESVLRQVLRRHLPMDVVVGHGYVVSPDETKTSSQIDILIYDGSKPVLFRDGDFVMVTADAVLALIEVKTSVTASTFDDAIVKLHRNIGIVREAPNIDACAGLFVFEEGGGSGPELIATIKTRSANFNERVDFVAIGRNLFIRFWESVPERPKRFFNGWRSYEMTGLAAGYFLHNIVDAIAHLPSRNAHLWFPPEGKEVHANGETQATWAAPDPPAAGGPSPDDSAKSAD